MKSSCVLIPGYPHLVLPAFTGVEQAAEPEIERIFGPEVKTGPYKHPACMTELEQRRPLPRLLRRRAANTRGYRRLRIAATAKGETGWSPPERIAHDPFRSVGNGVVWEAPDGVVWLFYVVRYGDTWSTSRVQAKISRDEAETWSDASMLVLDEGTLVRNRPIVLLQNGDYLLPLYHETGHDTECHGPRQLFVLPPLRGQGQDLDQDPADPLAQGKHPAGRGSAQRSRPGRLLPPRGRLQARDHRLHRPLRVARRRLDLERGQGLPVPQPQRGGRFPQAQERPAAPGLQPQHEPADAAVAGSLVRSGPDLAHSPRPA